MCFASAALFFLFLVGGLKISSGMGIPKNPWELSHKIVLSYELNNKIALVSGYGVICQYYCLLRQRAYEVTVPIPTGFRRMRNECGLPTDYPLGQESWQTLTSQTAIER